MKIFSETLSLPEFLNQKYLPSLDGLRALSILIVLIGHINDSRHFPIITPIFGNGSLGVQVFFVISGFLITTLLIKEKITKGDINLKKFYIRRAFRILPVAYLYILVVILLNPLFSLGITNKNFLCAIIFIQNFVADVKWPIGHYWSISVEEQFYLLFPFILKANYKLYVNVLLALLILSPIIFYLHSLPGFVEGYSANVVKLANRFLNRGLYSIVIGSITSILLCKYPINFSVNKWVVNIIQLCLIYLIWFLFTYPFLEGVNFVLMAVCITVFMVSAIFFTTSIFYHILNLNFFKTLGVLSYSIYIWQQLFTIDKPWKNSFRWGGSVIGNLIVLFLVAYLSYNYYEKPFLHLKKKFSS